MLAVAISAVVLSQRPSIVGYVLAISGLVQNDSMGRNLRSAEALRKGVKVTLKSGSQIEVAMLKTGETWRIVGPGTLTVSEGALAGSVAKRSKMGQFSFKADQTGEPPADRVRAAGLTMRGPGDPPTPQCLAPIRALRSPASPFIWTTVPGVQSFHFVLTGSDGLPIEEVDLPGNATQYLPKKRLEWGRTYSWTLRSTGEPKTETKRVHRFKVLTKADDQALVSVENLCKKDASAYVLLGYTYDQYELLYAALDAFQKAPADTDDGRVMIAEQTAALRTLLNVPPTR